MYFYIYFYIYSFILFISAFNYLFIYLFIYLCISIFIYSCIYICISTCIYLCISTCISSFISVVVLKSCLVLIRLNTVRICMKKADEVRRICLDPQEREPSVHAVISACVRHSRVSQTRQRSCFNYTTIKHFHFFTV